MTAAERVAHERAEHGNAYNIFILILTVFSLALMVVQLLPLDPETRSLVTVYDNAICFVFLADFAMNMLRTRPRSDYFIRERGWLDLIGSIPTFGVLPFTALFRLARISRLTRITRILGGENRAAIIKDVLDNRGQYATFITLLAAGMVLSTSSILVLQFESRDPAANIVTGGDALWWGVVTITTVGYGDYFPVTTLGRITGVSVMLAGVGIIGALASILASILVPPPREPDPEAIVEAAIAEEAAATSTGAPVPDPVAIELAALRAEIASLRASLSPPSG